MTKKLEKIKGVFSTQSVQQIGTGATVRKTTQKTFWFVNELEDDTIEIQPLNKNFIPAGPKRNASKEEFLAAFSPEPEFYITTVFPKMRELDQTIERGEEHRGKGELYSAEFEFGNAVKVDEENVRANFGLGLTYLERGERNKAQDIFQRLVKLDAAFEEQHKHLFNDFGISLRKNGMYNQALEYYSRALSLIQNDENLYYNIARAYYAKGEIQSAKENLQSSLRLNAQHKEARQFLDFLEKEDGSGRAYKEPDEPEESKSEKFYKLDF